MKQAIAIKRIFLGILFIEVLSSLVVCSYFIVTAILPEYNTETSFVINLITACLSIVIVTAAVLYYIYRMLVVKIEKKIYKILFIDMEPPLALEYVQRDLSQLSNIVEGQTENTVLQCALVHIFMANFEHSEVIMEHLHIHFFDRIKKSERNILLYHKVELLNCIYDDDRETFFEKYVEYHKYVDLHSDLDRTFPNEKLNDLIELFFVLFNLNSRLEIMDYIVKYEFKHDFEKYCTIAYLIHHEYKIPQYLLDQYDARLNSLFFNLER